MEHTVCSSMILSYFLVLLSHKCFKQCCSRYLFLFLCPYKKNSSVLGSLFLSQSQVSFSLSLLVLQTSRVLPIILSSFSHDTQSTIRKRNLSLFLILEHDFLI
uniref:Uncharacterized protein n=1 Tax=Cacopsylla melanoneura TaxID=428564 RepID=A0A8D8W075_9HEMI